LRQTTPKKAFYVFPITIIDEYALITSSDYIYVIKFKLNVTAEDALQQIEDKKYALPYTNDPRKLFKVGIEFSKKTRNIDQWLVQGRVLN